jgi:GDP-L-fucose synthase
LSVSALDLRGRRVMVTGGGGFLGSHVVRRCEAEGAIVSALGRADYDLVDRAATARAFREVRPEVVLHLAARVGGIAANQADPAGFFFDNAMMGLHVVEEARLAGVAKLVIVGTVCAYPKHTPVPFGEDALWDGYPEDTNAPYGLAKRMLLVQAQTCRQQYGLNAIYLLPANLYGPGDHCDLERSHVVPALIRKCLEAQAAGAAVVDVWGDGSATREFLYVEDAADGIVAATCRYDGAEPVNLGTGRELSIRDLAAAVARATGFTGTFSWNAARPNGQPRRALDVSRAERRFGFRARTSFEDGLARTVAWYRASLVTARA